MLDLVFKNHTSQKAPSGKFFKDVLNTGIGELKMKDKKVEVSLNLVGEAKIRDLNKKYRGKDKVTDVLSFPLEESRFKKYDILPLGDIFICLPFAVKEFGLRRRRNAKDNSRGAERQRISLEKELAWLTVHGFLHLLGYDHEISEASARKMFKLESKIMSKLQAK